MYACYYKFFVAVEVAINIPKAKHHLLCVDNVSSFVNHDTKLLTTNICFEAYM